MELKLNNLQTDNSYLEDKVQLRLNSLPDKTELNILDAYSGSGKIWQTIKQRTNKKLNILSIDKEQKQNKFILIGDNIKYLASMDLSKYDIIDLDAYGIPYKQLKIIFNKKYNGIIYVTFIQSIMGRLPNNFLFDLGFTKEMISKCPSLFGKKGFQYFKNWLSVNGVKSIIYRTYGRKYYLCFNIEFC